MHLPFRNRVDFLSLSMRAVVSILLFFNLSKLHLSPISWANSFVQEISRNSATFNIFPQLYPVQYNLYKYLADSGDIFKQNNEMFS